MKKPSRLKDKEGFVDSWQIRDKKDVHPSHCTQIFEGNDIQKSVDEVFEWLLKRDIAQDGITTREQKGFVTFRLVDFYKAKELLRVKEK